MKSVSPMNIALGVLVGIAIIYLKIFMYFSIACPNLDVIREKVIKRSTNNQEDNFFFLFKTYIFFVTRQDDEITVRIFRIIGFPVMTLQGDLRTGEIWEVR